MKNTIKKILFLTEVHGDEKIGTEVLNILNDESSESIDHIIANEEASKKNVRFVEYDLNRNAPGDAKSEFYEIRRTRELVEISKKYDAVLDIHGSTSETGIFTLITNPTKINLALACALPIQNIVIWRGDKGSRIGPLTEFMKCAVEIECGPKQSSQIKYELKQKITEIVSHDLIIEDPNFKNKVVFEVRDKIISKDAQNLNNLKDFEPISYLGENIIPLFIDQYQGILCYKLEKLEM